MANIKSLVDIGNKWTRVTPQRQEDYAIGVANPRKPWAQATQSANAAYKAGLQKSLADDRWVKGVGRAGDEKWARGAITKGPGRWAEGVQLAGDAYARGFGPYHRTIEGLTLPARGAKGDPKNIQRVAAVADAMHKTKISLGGA